MEKIPKLLVILPNNLGDTLMATPVLEGLKSRFPQCSISFLVERGFEGALINNPHCDRFIQIDRKCIKTFLNSNEEWQQGLSLLKEIVLELNKSSFSRIINLCQHPYLAYLVGCCQKPKKVVGRRFLPEGNHAILDPWSQYLNAIPFARNCNHLHAVDVYRRIAGVVSHSGRYTIRLRENECREAKEYLLSKGIMVGTQKIAFFQPTAAWPSKRWPFEHFKSLGLMLSTKGWRIVICGAPSEVELADALAKAIGPNAINTAGDLSFRQTIATLSLGDICVSGDTALMHASAALEKKTFALFGPTNPVETGPYGSGHWIFSSRCPSRPCFLTECKSQLCLKNITPEIVFHCIEKETPFKDTCCDIFRTYVKENSNYHLLETSSSSAITQYYNKFCSHLTRKAFELTYKIPALDYDTYDTAAINESKSFCTELLNMEKTLSGYLQTKSLIYIKQFELMKHKLSRFQGIGAFWGAVLNIRLNGVPMLDIMKGISRSLKACRITFKQIYKAINLIL